MRVLAIIPARASSKAVPGKCTRKLLGRAVVEYTIEAAKKAQCLDKIAITTDDPEVMDICDGYSNIALVKRPGELADDNARIDDAMRHCCCELKSQYGYTPQIAVLLYANIPVRAEGIIDRAVQMLVETGADSVQTIAPVGKFHPYWLYTAQDDKIKKYVDNKIYRRQELPKVYCVDGAVGVVRCDVLEKAAGNDDPHAFWGQDRRALIQEPHDTVDIDEPIDMYLAEAVLRDRENY